jgi:hypothetical protein
MLAAILVYIKAPLYMVVMSRVSCVLILLLYRFHVVGRLINFGLREYLLKIVLRLIFVGGGAFAIVSFINKYLREDIIGLLCLIVLSTCIISFLFYFIALTKSERAFCKEKAKFIWLKLF